MKGQYDIMEQEKQPEEKKSTNVMQKCIIAVLLIMLAITIVLCIRIGALEEKVNNFHNQMEEVKFTLDKQMNAGETKETAELQSDVNTELKENMVFTIEPGVYLENEFGIRIEDTVRLTKNGVQRLFTDSKELLIL